jgi:hypothetical protein
MSNKKRAIKEANILLEQRYLNENNQETTPDADGNDWYVSEVPNKSGVYRIYIQLKGGKRIDASEIYKVNTELYNKVRYYDGYFKDYNNLDDAKRSLNLIVNSIKRNTAPIQSDTSTTQTTTTDNNLLTQDELNKMTGTSLEKSGMIPKVPQ